jgi:hypothetical protein
MTESDLPVQDPTTAGRYLAGQLSDEEQRAYEALLLSHPEVLRELEATARLKVGLARLRERGDLDGLLQAPARAGPLAWLRQPAVVALAASFALAAVGVLLWRNTMPRADLLYSSLSALRAHSGASRSLVGHYTLLRTRSTNAEIVFSPPPPKQALELRVLPDIEPGADGYLVQLFRVRSDGSTEQRAVASSAALQPGADAFVTLYADSGLLSVGRYQLKVSPAGAIAGATAPSPEYFLIRVATPATAPESDSR